MLLALLAGGAAGVALHRADAERDLFGLGAATPVAPTPAASAEAAAPAPSAAASGPATSVPIPVSAAPSASAAAPPADASACLAGLFAAGTFEQKPALDFVCEGGKLQKTLDRLKTAIVAAGKNRTSDGMHEWALTGIYQLATLAVLRGRCCASPGKLEVPAPPTSCEPLAERMAELEDVVRKRAPAAEIDESVARFDKGVRCALRSQQEKSFGDYGPLGGGEVTAFRKTLARASAP